MSEKKEKIICEQCELELVRVKTKLNYMNMKFDAELFKCPKCGQIYIPEDLASGKIKEVEAALEEK